MKKKYKLTEEDPEDNKINEPAISYEKNQILSSTDQYTLDELKERIITATNHVEEGKFYTDEELDDFVLS